MIMCFPSTIPRVGKPYKYRRYTAYIFSWRCSFRSWQVSRCLFVPLFPRTTPPLKAKRYPHNTAREGINHRDPVQNISGTF